MSIINTGYNFGDAISTFIGGYLIMTYNFEFIYIVVIISFVFVLRSYLMFVKLDKINEQALYQE